MDQFNWESFLSGSQKFGESSELRLVRALEEAVIGMQKEQTEASEVSDEDAFLIAEVIDYLKGRESPSAKQQRFTRFLSENNHLAVPLQQVLRSLSVMKQGESKPVPVYLQNLVDYDYRTALKQGSLPETIPGIIVKTAKSGLEIVKSTLQGFAVREMAAVSVRSAALASTSRNTRIELEQAAETETEPKVIYNLIQETKDSLTLSISIRNNHGRSRIDLKQDGMITDSMHVQGDHSSANFSHLNPGFYEVDIRGALNRSFGVLIQGDL